MKRKHLHIGESMFIRKIGWQFFLVCFSITAISLWFTTWYSIHIYKQYYIKSTIEDVSIRSNLLSREFSNYTSDFEQHVNIDSICKSIGKDINARLTIILPSGKVIADSKADPRSMDNHLNRPEVSRALHGNYDREIRYSKTLKQNMLYVANPLYNKSGTITGVLRLAVFVNEIKDQEKVFYLQMIIASLIVFLLLGSASYILSQRLSLPIRHMKIGAQRFAKGDFDFKLPVPKGEELSQLSQALNSMAVALDDRIKTITRQRNEQAAILTSMNEGVIAVDNKERIISMNPAAAKIFGVAAFSVNGNWLHEIVRNSTLQKFLLSTLSSESKMETSFVLNTADGDVHIQAYGTVLNNEKNGPEGAVLVLNDVTRIRKLENLRKEFVANVSHELRTPLTSIKGFVETLRVGNYSFPEEVNHFLSIIANKTDNLCAIVDDILSLSSIERDHEHREISFALENICAILSDTIKTCEWKAVTKNISIELNCDQDLKAIVNASLLEQAIVNLIDNAIKYSNENTVIRVQAHTDNKEISIVVSDNGIGISEEHIERVFERFYRVDKARSRKLGGTGLGLSIVKNIVTSHGGKVTVQSVIGEGSTFKIILPVKDS